MTTSDGISIDPPASPGIDRRFIGVRPELIAAAIGDDARFGAASKHAIFDAIVEVIEMEIGALRREFDRRYWHHNPDADMHGPDSSEACPKALGSAIAYAFEKANFQRLEDVDVEGAMRAASSSGLKVKLNPDGVASLDLYVRGRTTMLRRRRQWRAPVRGRDEPLEVYRRLGVVVRPKEGEHIVLRLYRDIPVVDIEALLPHAEIAMSWTDRVKIAIGGAGAFGGIGAKIITGGIMMSPSSLAIPAAIAFGGLSVKSFLGYRRARHTRVSQRTHHLFNLSLAGNAAVLHALLGMVANEEINEAQLLYAALSEGGHSTPREAARAIEAWLLERFGVTVEFEIDDAMETLDRLSLWEDRAALRVAAPAQARERLRSHLVDPGARGYHLAGAGMDGTGMDGAGTGSG